VIDTPAALGAERVRLWAIACRMLGSAADAEDAALAGDPHR
jgi:DNA-directed RNA polymerase specialized sigma24 family protein